MCHLREHNGKTVRYKPQEPKRKVPYNRSKSKRDFEDYENDMLV